MLALLVFVAILPKGGLAMAEDSVTSAIQTEHFRFEFAESDRKMAEYLSTHAEQIRKDVTFFIGHDFKAVTRVVIAPDAASYATAQPRTRIPEWSVGVAFARENLIVLLSPRAALREDRNVEPLSTFRHEVSHIVLGKALGEDRAPVWLDEGIAEFQSDPWTPAKTWTMTVATLSGRAIPLHRLMSSWPRGEERAKLAYLQSHAFVDYLYRRGAVAGIVDRLAAGVPVPVAIEEATGIRFDDLDKEFQEFLERNYTWVHILASTDLAWGLATVIFVVVAVVAFFRSRKKLRRMELEDELEDLREGRAGAQRAKRRRTKYDPNALDDYLDRDYWH
ncbi:MAG: hypothetical protein KJ042_15160 [Deltaproteobacteria bacterium]|nr:hypothetical protein [Deltaproteobacteria bacterium]